MAFLTFPMLFADDDFEQKEALGLKAGQHEGEITINTQHICAYNAMDNDNTLVRMSNGECYEIPLDIEDFEQILEETEAIINITDIAEN